MNLEELITALQRIATEQPSMLTAKVEMQQEIADGDFDYVRLVDVEKLTPHTYSVRLNCK